MKINAELVLFKPKLSPTYGRFLWYLNILGKGHLFPNPPSSESTEKIRQKAKYWCEDLGFELLPLLKFTDKAKEDPVSFPYHGKRKFK